MSYEANTWWAAPTAPVMWWAGTTTVSSIYDVWATFWGTYTDGGSPITANGFVVYPAGNLSTVIWWANVLQVTDPILASPLSESTILLSASTNYCFKPYATNAIGTSYGTELCFTTTASPFIYTANLSGNSVSKIDTTTMTVVATTTWTNSQPHSAIRVGTNVYIGTHGWSSIQRIATATMTITGTIPTWVIGNKYTATDWTFLYVAGETGSLRKVDLSTFTVVWTATVWNTPYWVALDNGFAYVTNNTSNTVSKVDTTTMTTVGSVSVWTWPIWITIYNGFAYVANQNSATVSKIDLSTFTVVATSGALGGAPYWIWQSQWFIYVTAQAGWVHKLNPTTLAIITTIAVAWGPLSFQSVWNRWYIACWSDNTCKVLNTVTDTIINTVAVGAIPYWVAV